MISWYHKRLHDVYMMWNCTRYRSGPIRICHLLAILVIIWTVIQIRKQRWAMTWIDTSQVNDHKERAMVSISHPCTAILKILLQDIKQDITECICMFAFLFFSPCLSVVPLGNPFLCNFYHPVSSLLFRLMYLW